VEGDVRNGGRRGEMELGRSGRLGRKGLYGEARERKVVTNH